ncbi:MAG: hypothetical protein ACYCQJ_12645 [Nitrososphaerales archaeon]
MRIHFVSFADSRYDHCLNKIRKGAERSKFFDVIHSLSEKDLDQDFLTKHEEFIRTRRRGYGYWIWKPQVCLQVFRQMEDNDILVYADAGCTINYHGRSGFDNYLSQVQEKGIVACDMPFLEKDWTKGDLFQHLDAWRFATTRQFHATFFLLRKDKANQAFLEKWSTITQQYHLLDDSRSTVSNLPGFCEHRHDQSIFSLLQKLRGTVPENDGHDHHNFPFDWDTMLDTPIWITKLVNCPHDPKVNAALQRHDL